MGLRALFATTFLIFSGLCFGQDPPKFPLTFPPRLYSLGGNDFVELTVKVGLPERQTYNSEYCGSECGGSKHFRHSDCDYSCDAPCEGIHKWLAGWRKSFRGPDTYADAVEAMGKRFGSLMNPAGAIQQLVVDLNTAADGLEGKTLRIGHVPNPKPCEIASGEGTVDYFNISATVTLYREVVVDGKVIRTTGPSDEFFLGWLANYSEEHKWIRRLRCRCEILFEPEPTKEVGLLPSAPAMICVKSETGVAPLSTKLESEIALAITCPSMSQVSVTAQNPTSEPMEICVQPGTVLISSDPKVQDEMVTSEIRMVLPAAHLFASTLGIPGEPVTATGNARCINFKKKAPDGKQKFKWRFGNQKLAALAQFESKQRRIGVHDQVRTWLYTDAPTLEEIQNVLIPPPSGGMYAREAINMFQTAQEDPSDAKYKGLFDPAHLDAVAGSPENISEYVRLVSKLKTKECVAWLNRIGISLMELIADDRDVAKEHLAAVMNGFATSAQSEVRAAALKAIEKGITKEQLDRLGAANALDGALSHLMNSDISLAEASLRIAERAGGKFGTFHLLNVHASLPESLKTKAKALAQTK